MKIWIENRSVFYVDEKMKRIMTIEMINSKCDYFGPKEKEIFLACKKFVIDNYPELML